MGALRAATANVNGVVGCAGDVVRLALALPSTPAATTVANGS